MIKNMNNSLIKTDNQAQLLKTIINEKEISRSELAKLTNISKASTSTIVSTLLNHSLIYESHVGESSGSGGRRPIYLKFNPNAASIISINIKTNSINSLLTTLDGKVLNRIRLDEHKIERTRVVDDVISIIDEHINKQPKTPHGIVGIGIAIHGVVSNNQIKFTPNYALENTKIHEKLTANYDIPIFIENEANLGALGEFVFSTHHNSLINVNIHSGVGAGVIENGNLLVGQSGYVGEMGHTILYPGGKACSCGNNGCLEQYISDDAIISELAKYKKNDSLNIKDIIKYAENKDEVVVNILEQFAINLSVGINNLICFYDPEIIIINSKIFSHLPHLIQIISNHLKSRITIHSNVQTTQLAGDSTLYGCTALVLQEFFKFNKIKFI